MDWNVKWDWKNLDILNPKIVESFEKQTTESVDLYEGQYSKSGSELQPGSSARSSVSVCTESSLMAKTQVAFGKITAFPGEKEDLGIVQEDETSPSVGSGESTIGLKLGKRMYFGNNSMKGNTKTGSLPEVPQPSTTVSNVKKIKSSSNSSILCCCQVEGCNVDLSSAKEYHRKHKVCASHAKCPKVVVEGLERRFCQQCSRFHSLTEFDEKKRSCRKRLSDHNTRRRKPQLDPMQYNKMMMMRSPFSVFTSNNGKRQMSIESNNVPQIYSRSSLDATGESTLSTMFKTTKESLLKFEKTATVDEQLLRLPSMTTKSGSSLNRGYKDPVLPPNMDPAPGYHRALSLLSNDSWVSYPPPNNSIDHFVNGDHMHRQPSMQEFPPTQPEFCLIEDHSALITANDTGQFQLFKPPYNDSLHSNLYS